MQGADSSAVTLNHDQEAVCMIEGPGNCDLTLTLELFFSSSQRVVGAPAITQRVSQRGECLRVLLDVRCAHTPSHHLGRKHIFGRELCLSM